MQHGVIKKNLSRTFKIKTVFGQDDPACMKEVVKRRLKHSLNEENGAFGKLPDCIFADGGITQMRAIKEAIDETIEEIMVGREKDLKNEVAQENISKISTKYEENVENLKQIAIFGMVKNDKHETRALIDMNRCELKLSTELMNLITLFQDTVHNTAIGYHKKLRNKEITKSELDEIEGIGPAKKKLLLQTFGSTQKIKEASIEELTKVKGINEELARKIKTYGN